MRAVASLSFALSIDPQQSTALEPRALRILASALDESGLDYVLLPELHRGQNVGSGLDPVLAAAVLARRTQRIGVVASVSANFAEPFHAAKEITTLDFASRGRAGAAIAVTTGLVVEKAATGLHSRDEPDAPADQLAEYADTLRALWDSWEEDAIIRDSQSERYLDAARVHHVNVVTSRYSVVGPLITPRPPQGNPPVFASVADEETAVALSSCADVVIRPWAAAVSSSIRVDGSRHVRELAVRFVDSYPAVAETLYGSEFVGTPEQLVDILAAENSAGLLDDGVLFRSQRPLRDSYLLGARVLPALVARGVTPPGAPRSASLRERLNLAPAQNRFEAIASA
jgi:alkanesulfonate monooxygenase SsuD/methylene tetrahydromethanopterin reductase-like flavin-dependent oxidoreductase (luciferase family)